MRRFADVHPLVSVLYFVSILVFTMFFDDSRLLFISLLGGILFYIKIEKQIQYIKVFGFYFLLFVIITITNPLFSHKGTKVLFFINNNPITLEAIIYGAQVALMLIAVMYWFKCLNLIMTEDKILYLFGRFSPKMALLFSTVLRLIPLFKLQATKIRQSQKTMGLFASEAWIDKLRGSMRVYSALITWGLENAIDTGSSMKARGYGLKGRTNYSLLTFRQPDLLTILLILLMDVMIVASTEVGLIVFAILGFLPFIFEVKEELQWKYYKSKI